MERIKKNYHSKRRVSYCLSLACFLLFTGLSAPAYANKVNAENDIYEKQQTSRKITGVVKDDEGEPLIGVTVGIKGNSTVGTFTDIDGSFTITTDETATLTFSFVGFETQEVRVSSIGTDNTLNINMQPDARILEEVVVVGYGVQKKVNLTGSVATISNKQIEARPVTNVSTSLGGLAPGLSVRQGSGMPGEDGATLRIRGAGSFTSGSDPLVIIDGMEGSMDAVNPQDVESISVLKDAASASIYGSRAANGVILITTKKGIQGKPKISFSGILSISQPSNRPKFVKDYISYMGYMNEAAENANVSKPFSEQDFENWTYANANPNELNEWGYPMYVAYPNIDWWDVVLKNKVSQTYNIGVTGGMEHLKYNISLGYMNNKGVVDHTGLERYQARVNLESKIAKFLTVGTQTFFSTSSQSVVNMTNVWNYLRQTTPGIYPEYDGMLGGAVAQGEAMNANNIIQYLTNTGGNKRVNRLNTTWFARFDIMKGLSFETKINYSNTTTEHNTYPNQRTKYNFATNTTVTVAGSPKDEQSYYYHGKSYRITSDNVLRYNITIANDHDIAAMVGHNEYYYNSYNFNATGKGLIDKSIRTLSNTTEAVSVGGSEYDYAMRSFFGRINYAYKSKYLLEANIRRDGSSRFDKDHRWGTFPSVSLGWRISEEEFMGQSFRNIFDNLKIRGSYGKLGNNELRKAGSSSTLQYGYMNNYTSNSTSLGGVYSFGGTGVTALTIKQMGNPLLMWEETRVADIGIDGIFLNGRASFEFDYYNRKTDKILYTTVMPLVMGSKDAPFENLGEMTNKGIELSLNWQDRINDFSYSIGANVSYNINEVTKFKGRLEESLNGKTYSSNFGSVASGISNGYIIEGHMLGEYATRVLYRGTGNYFHADGTVDIHGGPRDGMIRTEQDMEWVKAMMASDEKYKFNGRSSVSKTGLWYGDFIYADTNGNGDYGDATDRKFLGTSTMPKWNLGINLSAEWKGFDLSMLWQGAFKASAYRMNTGENTSNLVSGFQLPEMIASDHYFYDPENPDDPRTNLTGKYPRLKLHSGSISDHNYLMSDFYIEDVSYMRLKNLQVGYTLPKQLVNKIGVGSVRVYFSGENLLTITSYKGLDPETQTYMSYPTLKQVAFGINVNF